MSNKEQLTNFIIWGILAGAGGLARFLTSRMEEAALPIAKGRFFFLLAANVLVSGFSGLMGALLMSVVTPEQTWHFVSAGVFGFGGAKALEMLSDKLSQKF